jgi:hypothetical protein
MTKIKNKEIIITKKQLLSDVTLQAWQAAEYRLRHNDRYCNWNEEKRLKYCLTKVFEAIKITN